MTSRSNGLSQVARIARYFRAHEHRWVDGLVVASIASGYAWRTRISDLRRAPYHMTVENRQRRVRRPDGTVRRVVSEYRYSA